MQAFRLFETEYVVYIASYPCRPCRLFETEYVVYKAPYPCRPCRLFGTEAERKIDAYDPKNEGIYMCMSEQYKPI